MLVMFFAPTPEALPQPRRGGGSGCVSGGCDIVRVHRAQVCDYVYQGQRGRNLVAKVGPSQGHPASYLLFDGRLENESDFGEDAATPYRSSSRGFSWEPEAEPAMLEALRLLSSYLARQAREAEAAFLAAAAAAEAEEGGGAAAAAAAATAAPPPLLIGGPPPSAVRHLGLVLTGEAGSGDLGPVRVEAVEESEGSTGAAVLWVFDGSDAPPLLGGGGAAATATLSRLSAVLAAAAAAASGGENTVVDDATAAAINGEKASNSGAGEVVVPAGPARDASALPETIRDAILGGREEDGSSGRRRVPPASSLSSLPSVGTVLPVVLALPRGAPRPPLPEVGEWITIHKMAAASIRGQIVGVYLESSHWARAASASSSSSSSGPSPPFRADPAAREREGETASWAPTDLSLLVAVPRTGEATAEKKGKKRGRGEEDEAALPPRATLRALTLRARAGSDGDGAAVRARVLCRVLRAAASSSSSSPSSSSRFDLDLVLEDATGVAEASLRGKEAEAFFGPLSTSGFSLDERCAGLVAGGAARGSSQTFIPWAELVLEASAIKAGAAAAVSKSKKRRGRGGKGGGAKGDVDVAFAVVDSVSRWPAPPSAPPPSAAVASPLRSPVLGSAAASPLPATQMVPRSFSRTAAAGRGAMAAALAATQAPPPLLLAPTQAPDFSRGEWQQQQFTQTQAAPAPAAGLAEMFVLSPLRRMTARVMAALPGGGGESSRGDLNNGDT